MYNIAATVAGALLAGGAVLYGGYVYVEGRGGDDLRLTDAGSTVRDEGVRVSEGGRLATRRDDALGRGGVPEGTRPLSFDEGAPGDAFARDVAALRAEEATSRLGQGDATRDGRLTTEQAERLAALGDGDDPASLPSGLRGPRASTDDAAPRLRGEGPSPAPVGAPDGIGASTGLGAGGAVEPGTVPERGTVLARTARLSAKPDGAAYFTRNQRLTDKPDTAGYFTQNAPADRFAPCQKADGTPYVGPGTATNAFASEDPCLPRGTAQSFELARLDVPTATASDSGQAIVPVGFGVPLGGAFRGVSLVPPSGGNFGSDYRGG